MQTLFFSFISLLAFAANSIVGRLALGQGDIDPAGFTVLRLLSAIVMLLLIIGLRSLYINSQSASNKPLLPTIIAAYRQCGSMFSALMLLAYAVSFSYAYVALDTATGALILFTGVQLTMNAASIYLGHTLSSKEIVGTLLAFIGLVYLLLPYINTPSFWDFLVMFVSGISWAMYTLSGKGSDDPIGDTAANFLFTLPGVILLLLWQILWLEGFEWTTQGAQLAVISGAITSALGYSLWYVALRGLTVSIASVIQLSVPIIAAIGGVLFLSESISLRLMLSALMILGGIAIVIVQWPKKPMNEFM